MSQPGSPEAVLEWRYQTAIEAVRPWFEREMEQPSIYDPRVFGDRFEKKRWRWILRRPRFHQPDTGFQPNTCLDCDCAESSHYVPRSDYFGRALGRVGQAHCRCGDCQEWIGWCLICRTPSPTAYSYRRTRCCRNCRRYIKHKEKELWLRNLAIRNQRRDLQDWRQGAKYLREVRKLLNPEPSKSPDGESELVLTSRTS